MKSIAVLLLAVFVTTLQNAKLTAADTTIIDDYGTIADTAGDGSTNDPTETEVTQTDVQTWDVTSGGLDSVTNDSVTHDLTTGGDGLVSEDGLTTGGDDVVTGDELITSEDDLVTGGEMATGGDELVTGDVLATDGHELITGDEETITDGVGEVTHSDELPTEQPTEPPSSAISVRCWSLTSLLLATAVGRLLVRLMAANSWHL